MSPTYNNVIVFGPTGTVGGLVALEAQKRGAKVWLAMRDTTKPIKGIPQASDVEKSGNFERIQADLEKPSSVAQAITKSGAKAAYLYLIQSSPDFSRATLQAMRDAGVEYIVFLSSYTVLSEGAALRALTRDQWIPFAHAQVEINVENIGFPYFTTLRPAFFASNYITNSFDRSASPPKATLIYEDAIFDNITPEDMGAVGGAVLVQRPSDRKETIYLCGPELRTAKENWELIKTVTGRSDIDITPSTPEQFVESLTAKGMPAPMSGYLVNSLEKMRRAFREPEYKIGAGNVEKFAGRKPTKFIDYLEAHKAEWQD